MSLTLMSIMMLSYVFAYVRTHQIVCIKYVFFVYQLYPDKIVF